MVSLDCPFITALLDDQQALDDLWEYQDSEYVTIDEALEAFRLIDDETGWKITLASFAALHGPTCSGPDALERVIQLLWEDEGYRLQSFVRLPDEPVPTPCSTCALLDRCCHGRGEKSGGWVEEVLAYQDEDLLVGTDDSDDECDGFPGALQALLSLILGRKLKHEILPLCSEVVLDSAGTSDVGDASSTALDRVWKALEGDILQAESIRFSFENHGERSAMEALLPDLLRHVKRKSA